MCKSLLANHRPVSLLTVFPKWFELVVLHRINRRLQVHNILSVDQFGFRKELSTVSVIYKLNESVLSHGTRNCMLVTFCMILSRSFIV